TAMVMGELIATGELEQLSSKDVTLDLGRPLMVEGISMSDGIGLGHVVLHEPRVLVTNLFNEKVDDEIQRLRDALLKVQVSLDVLLQNGTVPTEGEHRDVLEAFRMFAHDRGWNRRMEEAIRAGLTAEAAVEKVQNDNRARMVRVPDPYLRDRLNDFDDLANRLLRELVGKSPLQETVEQGESRILVARTMGAAELLEYHNENLRGLVLEEAAPTSHVVIVAKALGIPVVGQLSDIVSNAESGNRIIVDGNEGKVWLRPQQNVEHAYVDKIKFQASRQKQFAKLVGKPPITLDGEYISLNMNAGLLMDMSQLDQSGADGIGLYRTELQFMVASSLPRPGEQETLYRRILDEAGDRPVTFRTIDVGGDKVLPYLKTAHEENPALGWRAIRLSLDRPGLLRSQIRALLRAASGRKLRLMAPMVSEVWELREVRQIIRREVELQTRFGHEMPMQLELGCMLEVPSLLYQIDELMREADFIAVGSNDLFQFIMASDRGNPRLANRYTPLSKPFLRILRQICEKGREHQTPVKLCGEIAGRPLSAMALIALGFRSISMSPAAIGPVKAMLMSLDVSELRADLFAALDNQSEEVSVTELLMDFADRYAIPY
ncbi:MAG: phosphoenolpyruvate--protein phosphotransferase, partial [Pseudomonadota bacterium]